MFTEMLLFSSHMDFTLTNEVIKWTRRWSFVSLMKSQLSKLHWSSASFRETTQKSVRFLCWDFTVESMCRGLHEGQTDLSHSKKKTLVWFTLVITVHDLICFSFKDLKRNRLFQFDCQNTKLRTNCKHKKSTQHQNFLSENNPVSL